MKTPCSGVADHFLLLLLLLCIRVRGYHPRCDCRCHRDSVPIVIGDRPPSLLDGQAGLICVRVDGRRRCLVIVYITTITITTTEVGGGYADAACLVPALQRWRLVNLLLLLLLVIFWWQ